MTIFSSKKRVAAIGALTAITVAGGGVAFAYWTTTGSGTGSASTAASDASVTIAQGSLSPMYPGDAAQTLQLTVTNNSATQAAYVGTLTASVTTAAGANCDASNFLINGSPASNPVTLNWTAQDIAAAGSVPNSANTIQFNNKPLVNQDLCKDVAVSIAYSAS